MVSIVALYSKFTSICVCVCVCVCVCIHISILKSGVHSGFMEYSVKEFDTVLGLF